MVDERSAPATAVVAAGNEETRVLLRGLLRLHHYQVVGESDGGTAAAEMVKKTRPTVLVADVSLAEGEVATLLQSARLAHPAIRVILVAPDSRRAVHFAPAARPDVTLHRPFRIREFAEALPAPEAGENPSTVGAAPP
jgi:DNA-binding NarL/FixJ family response regulator